VNEAEGIDGIRFVVLFEERRSGLGRPRAGEGSFEGLRGPKQSAPHQNQDSVLDRGEGRCVEKR
jgi:hypothetical protein